MYTVRNAQLNDMSFIMELAENEGWNPGLSDKKSFFCADPNGFFIGELDGEQIGCISAVSYGSFGFIGLYIIKEGYRGNGYGMVLWNNALSRLQDCNIGLDGVVAQQANYKKSGFRLAHRNLRFEGVIETTPLSRAVVPAESIPFDTIADYDVRCFPAARKAFLSNWINMPYSHTLGYYWNDKVYGYGTIRQCVHGYKIGPLFADTCEIAESLFLNLTLFAKQSPVYLDITETNQAANALCKKFRMMVKFETARMYTGEAPDIHLENVYGITTFELG